MEDLIIKATNNSPLIEFTSTGNFKIHGRIITENAVVTFQPLFDWIANFEGEEVRFDIELDYINTSATMQLFSFLKLIDENCGISDIAVRWFYDEDDEDHLETGEFYEDRLDRVKFEFLRLEEKDIA